MKFDVRTDFENNCSMSSFLRVPPKRKTFPNSDAPRFEGKPVFVKLKLPPGELETKFFPPSGGDFWDFDCKKCMIPLKSDLKIGAASAENQLKIVANLMQKRTSHSIHSSIS